MCTAKLLLCSLSVCRGDVCFVDGVLFTCVVITNVWCVGGHNRIYSFIKLRENIRLKYERFTVNIILLPKRKHVFKNWKEKNVETVLIPYKQIFTE
jgi:hypothetical protein